MTESGEVDLPSLERLLDLHLEAKTDNLCVLGTTAEASLLSMAERKTVLDTVVAKAKGRIPILVGTGTIDPTKVREMTLQAMDCGADASLVVTPYYIKPPQRGLIRHFCQAADLGLPVVVYNVPGRTSVDMSDAAIATVATHENVVGLKDATGNPSRVKTLQQELDQQGVPNNDFLLYSGDDGTTLDFLQEGGHGCISVTANIVPAVMHQMVQAGLEGNTEEAMRLNTPLANLHQTLFCEANPIPAKWCLHRMGLIDGPFCRPPLVPLDPQYESILEEALQTAGITTV